MRRPPSYNVLAPWIAQAMRDAAEQAHLAVRMAENMLGSAPFSDLVVKDGAPQDAIQLLKALPRAKVKESAYQFLLVCGLAGAARTRDRIERRKAKSNGRYRRIVATDVFAGPFARAVKSLVERAVLSSDAFDTLEAAARNRAGRIAGMNNVRLVEDIYQALTRTVEDGGTTKDFRDKLALIPKADGWAGSDPWHAHLVYATNAQLAYQSGHVAKVMELGVKTYTWRATNETCAICEPYVDEVFSYEDTSIFPGGVHFNCDCDAEPIVDPDLEDEDSAAIISDIPNAAYDKAFKNGGILEYDPKEFGNLTTFDPSTLPSGLRQSFRRFIDNTDQTII